MRSKGLLSSESNEWYTPPEFMRLVYQVLGDPVGVDPASNPEKNVRAYINYVKEDNGLIHPWIDRVFLNPPYGQDVLTWVDKLINERPRTSITLLGSNTDTKYFHKLAGWADCVLFRKGRLSFIPGPGNTSSGSTVKNAVFYRGPDLNKFMRVFKDEGTFMVKPKGEVIDGFD